MGGCRCTYRNCNVRSDGKTHMFHYPVFDKIRCHQWLTNAQRLEFLSLKVSQLKNRVVCQHHFTDEMFMNFKKDRLKCSAIPTELGPYCEPQDSVILEIDISPIKSEYIESEPLHHSVDKKSKFSVKYGDFLTNCEVMELENAIQPTKKFKATLESYLNTLPNKSALKRTYILNKGAQPLAPCQLNNDPQLVSKGNELMDTNKNPPSVGILTEEQVKTNSDKQYLSIIDDNTISNKNRETKTSKIVIISEEPFTNPIRNIKTLIPLSKSALLHPSEKHNKAEAINSYSYKDSNIDNINLDPLNNFIQNVSTPTMEQRNEDFVVDNTISTGIQVDEKDAERNNGISNQEKDSFTPKAKKLSHNRIADIEKKRKFNKKLKEIISENLYKIVDHELGTIKPIKETNSSDTSIFSQLASEPELPSIDNYLVNFLDARMKRMENTLLNRIDANSKNITQLKACLNNEKIDSLKKKKNFSVCTQTLFDEESCKKYLYNEISQYLSVEVKSKVFEDLFINKRFEPKPKNVRTRRQK